MTRYYLRQLDTNKLYEVLTFDKVKKTLTLKAEDGPVCPRYDSKKFKQLNYVFEDESGARITHKDMPMKIP